jgi:uncharacterized protein
VSHVQEHRKSRGMPFIDCDVHPAMPSEKTLYRYLPRRWVQHHEIFGLSRYQAAYYPRGTPNAARADAWPPSGKRPGSDLTFMREQLLDAYNIQYAILNPENAVHQERNLEYAAAIARAMNDWQTEEWLNRDSRFRASVIVVQEDSDLAAAEVDRVSEDPRFAQILLVARTSHPLGNRKYWKLYEAAVRHNLPIGIHYGGYGGNPITGAGWPSFYIEDHVGASQACQAQVISFVYEGVFERFPTLKVALVEGGYAWVAPLAWRLDSTWKRLHKEVPDVKRLPSEYVREHIWHTTQPMEEPPRREHFIHVLESLGLHDRLMFSTDYPHWDFDSPDQAFPIRLPEALQQKIMIENARSFYRL